MQDCNRSPHGPLPWWDCSRLTTRSKQRSGSTCQLIRFRWLADPETLREGRARVLIGVVARVDDERNVVVHQALNEMVRTTVTQLDIDYDDIGSMDFEPRARIRACHNDAHVEACFFEHLLQVQSDEGLVLEQ